MSEKALQIAEKGREPKGKREKERYTQLNEEFQRIAGKIRKPFLVNNAKNYRKTTEWERLALSSRKLEISREYFRQGQAQ